MNDHTDETRRVHYLAPRALLEKYRWDFHNFGYRELPGDMVLMHASFLIFEVQDKFEAEPNVSTFPHWSSPRPIGTALAGTLATAGVTEALQIEPILEGDTMDVACRKIGKKWPEFPTEAHRIRLKHP